MSCTECGGSSITLTNTQIKSLPVEILPAPGPGRAYIYSALVCPSCGLPIIGTVATGPTKSGRADFTYGEDGGDIPLTATVDYRINGETKTLWGRLRSLLTQLWR